MAEEHINDSLVKLTEDGINAGFSLSPRPDQAFGSARSLNPALRRAAQGGRQHHHRNHSIDTKDRTSPILGFGSQNDRSWSIPESTEDHVDESSSSTDPFRPSSASPEANNASGSSARKPYTASNLSAHSPSVPVSVNRKVSSGSTSSSGSSTGSVGNGSPETSHSPEAYRSSSRQSDRHHGQGPSVSTSDLVGRRNASPGRSYSGAHISPRLQSSLVGHVGGYNHVRRVSAEPPSAPYRAPSPIFLPSISPPTGPVNPDPQHSWDSVWPRSSTPDRADQLRRLGSSSPTVGSPGPASPSYHPDPSNLARSPSAAFETSSPSPFTTPVLGRPKARRPHELRGSSSSPVLRGHRELQEATKSPKSPRRSLEAGKSEPVLKVGFQPVSHSSDLSTSAMAFAPSTSGNINPAERVLSPATEAMAFLDASTAIVSHRTNGAMSSWIPERTQSPSAVHLLDPRKRSSSATATLQLPLPVRTPSPKISPTSPRSPFLELSASSPGANGSYHPMSESPPKTRSFIAMPPRSGYELSDDPDDVGSEDGSNSERESVGTNDGDTDEPDDDDNEHSAEHDVEEDHTNTDSLTEQVSDAVHYETSHDPQQDTYISSSVPPERPSLPKRPSLTRSSVVPPPVATSDQLHGPLEPMGNAESSMRSLAAQKGSTSSSMLHYFKDPKVDFPDSGRPQINVPSNEQVSDAVMPSALGLDATGDRFVDEAMEEDDDQGFGNALENSEDSLNTLERVFLFAKSDMAYHRVLVSQSLPEWIREVELNDAVEYIIPLLHGLATDELDVCAAFAPEIGRVMWFFFRNCPLAELADEPSDSQHEEDRGERATRPKISLATFTTLLCALLLNQNTLIAGATQQSLVQFFYRLERRDLRLTKEELASLPDQDVQRRQSEQDLESYITHASGRDGQPVPHEEYDFDANARSAVKTELLENVALALAQITHDRPQTDNGHGNDDAASFIAQVNQKDDSGSSALEMDQSQDVGGGAQVDESENSATITDAMEEDMGQAIGGMDVWSQAENVYGQHSNSSDSELQIDEDEEAAVGRMASVSLLSALAADELISQESLVDQFAPEMLKLIDDRAFYVRKEVAASLGPLSKNMEVAQIIEMVLPALNKAIHDRNWHVRQAACFSLPNILCRLGEPMRRDKTLLFMRALVNDVSRQLRIAALEIIGETIYIFKDSAGSVPQELIRFFLGEPFDGPPQQGDTSLSFDQTNDPDGTEMLFEEDGRVNIDSDAGYENQLGMNETDSLLATFGYGKGEATMGELPWDVNFLSGKVDPERPLIVAFNMPAVVLTLGRAQWGRLKHAHAELTQNPAPRVRKSLAASLHEISKIIGPDASRDDLLPAAERFINDEDGEVRAAMLENIDVFLAHLPQLEAERLLRMLLELWSTGFSKDWRLRERIALHVPNMTKQFLLEDEEGNLVSLMQLALSDPISAVRDAGVHCVPDLYKTFAEHDQVIADGFLGMISDLGDNHGYRLRVACLLCIKALVDFGIQRSSCELLLLSRLTQTGEDPVVDVRIALAQTVGVMCRKEELYASPQSRSAELNALISRLAHDESEEVRQPVIGVLEEDELRRYSVVARPTITTQRRLILGPADGGPHKPEFEAGFTHDLFSAEKEVEGNMFEMDDEKEILVEDTANEPDINEEASGENPTESAQHLEMSRCSFFSGNQKQDVNLGQGWVTAKGPELFDYDNNDDDEEDYEPHHLLNVDQDSNGSGEMIEEENEQDELEGKVAGKTLPAPAERRGGQDEEGEVGELGISLSSPQRGVDGTLAETAQMGGAEDTSPSRSSGSTAKVADPFLAFVAGRRSQDLSKLTTDLGQASSSPTLKLSKRRSTLNGIGEAASSLASSGSQEVLESPEGDEIMGGKYFSKSSGDWSQLRGASEAVDARHDSETPSTASDTNEDDFVRIEA